MSGGYDELLAEAQQRLAEQEAEEAEASAGLGESVDLAEGEAFVGPWRGQGKAWTKRGEVDVYLLTDTEGKKRFIWPKARLTQEIENLQPQVGDIIAIVRGVDIPNDNPAYSPAQRFAVRVRSSNLPLPDAEPEASGEPGPAGRADDDIPFAPTIYSNEL